MTGEMSVQHQQYFRSIFDEFDQNGDCLITKEQLRVLMAALGENLDEGMIDELVSQIDQDSSGSIDCDQFLHLMKIYMSRADPKREFRKAFGIFDRDGNGSISSTELKQVMINLQRGLTNAEAQEIYRLIGKEEIDEQEFIKLLMTSQL